MQYMKQYAINAITGLNQCQHSKAIPKLPQSRTKGNIVINIKCAINAVNFKE